jgi:DNA-binding MurR/RpiR family transcriptional regulator
MKPKHKNQIKSEGILGKIREYVNSDDSTNTQKEIGNFIINNYEDLPDMQLKEFINIVNASKSTVIRFLKKFGLNGYKELVFRIESEINGYELDVPYIDNEDKVGFKISRFFSIINLHDEKNNFTPSEKKVFNYLMNNLKKIPDLSIEDFANKTDVSTATVSNFISNQLNVDNYLELKKMLSEHFGRQEALINLSPGTYNSYSYKPENSLLDLDTISSLLSSIESNIYRLLGNKDSSINKNFGDLIKNATNILIFDLQNTAVNLLHDNLNDLGFTNFHVDSYEKALKKIVYLRKNRDIQKQTEVSIHENNLIIIMATDKYNKKINDIIDKSIKNNFSIILFEASHTSKAIGEYPEIDLRINIGDSFIVNENNTRETITLTIIMEILINQFKKSI